MFTYPQHHPVINHSEDQFSFRETHKTTSEATPGVQRTSASEAMVLLENDDALPLLLFVGVFEPRDPVRAWPRVTEGEGDGGDRPNDSRLLLPAAALGPLVVRGPLTRPALVALDKLVAGEALRDGEDGWGE